MNEAGEGLGVRVGTTALDAAKLLKKASAKTVEAPAYQEAREVREAGPSGRRLVLMDSASLVREEDAGQVVVTGSHGGLQAPTRSRLSRPTCTLPSSMTQGSVQMRLALDAYPIWTHAGSSAAQSRRLGGNRKRSLSTGEWRPEPHQFLSRACWRLYRNEVV